MLRTAHYGPRRRRRKSYWEFHRTVSEEHDVREAVGAAPIDYDGFCRAVAELGHVCFCHAIDVEGVGRVWTPAKDDDPLRALFRVISSSKAFYAAQKHSAALW